MPSTAVYFCESPACRSVLLALVEDGQPVAQAWRVPMTARCAACGCDLYAKATGQEQKVLEATQ
jgi:hypothetical protein